MVKTFLSYFPPSFSSPASPFVLSSLLLVVFSFCLPFPPLCFPPFACPCDFSYFWPLCFLFLLFLCLLEALVPSFPPLSLCLPHPPPIIFSALLSSPRSIPTFSSFPFLLSTLSFFAQSPYIFPSSYISFFPLFFYMYISSSLITLTSLSLLPSHPLRPSSKLPAFLSSPLAFF